MSSGRSGVQAAPSGPVLNFSPTLLIELLVCGILTLFFLFYFNRGFGKIVAYLVCAYTWHTYRVIVDIQALQISLLAGRIFFKGFRYHGDNETVLIHSGYITWRYWLRNVSDAECTRPRLSGVSHNDPGAHPGRMSDQENSDNGAGGETHGPQSPNDLPCRLLASVQGLEWFVYNRSAAYDAVVESLSAAGGEDDPDRQQTKKGFEKARSESVFTSTADTNQGNTRWWRTKGHRRPFTSSGDGPTETKQSSGDGTTSPPSDRKAGTEILRDTSQSTLLRFFPIRLECHRGAIILGNPSTKSILTMKFENGNAEVDAKHAQVLDHYKEVFDIELTKPLIQMRPNARYKDSRKMTAQSTGVATKYGRSASASQRNESSIRGRLQSIWARLRRIEHHRGSADASRPGGKGSIQCAASAADDTHDDWIGLSRYLIDGQREEQRRWDCIEYARFENIFDGPSLRARLYWDVPGIIPSGGTQLPDGLSQAGSHALRGINGGSPPDWGLDLNLRGGAINYGPWADRQRTELQSIFFPRLCTDTTPTKKLKAGDTRTSTVFKLFVEIEEDLTLRTPTREESKDGKWNARVANENAEKARGEGKVNNKAGQGGKAKSSHSATADRPFGWLDIKLKANSTINYSGDLVADDRGYGAKLDLELYAPEISTSVNHDLFLRADHANISCDLSTPLSWNGLRAWKFDIGGSRPEIFLLRDHIFLMTDLVSDWASGPEAEYCLFVPFRYLLNFHMTDFRFLLNVNDNNIINKPADLDDNTFIIIRGMELAVSVVIPLSSYRPTRSEVQFDVEGHNGGLTLNTPLWNTQATFLDNDEVAHLKDLGVSGRYNYFAATSARLTDTLELDVHAGTLSCDLFGFFVRSILKLKDNYLGDDVHFRTLEEYQDLLAKKNETSSNREASSEILRRSNDLDLILTLDAEDCRIKLPANLYSAKENLRLDLQRLDLELRFTSYYMDLQVDFSPLSVLLGSSTDGMDAIFGTKPHPQAFVDGVTIYGHRLFGLPPMEPTYVCNWDIDLGSITGECSSRLLKAIVFAFRNIAFTFDDDENALPLIAPVDIHDVTFLRLRLRPIRVWIHIDDEAVLFSTGAISLDFNDWADTDFSARLKLKIPTLTLASIDTEKAQHRHSSTVEPLAFLTTSVELVMSNRVVGASDARLLQQQHMRLQDQRTARIGFLLRDQEQLRQPSTAASDLLGSNPPAMIFPYMPVPIRTAQLPNAAFSLRSTSNREWDRSSSSLRSKGSSLLLRESFNSSVASLMSSPPHPALILVTKAAERTRSRSLAPPLASRLSALSLQSLKSSNPSPSGSRRGFPRSGEQKRGPTPVNVASPSSFIQPHFPLLDVSLDTSFKSNHAARAPMEWDQFTSKMPGAISSADEHSSKNAGHTKVLCVLESGVQAFTNIKIAHTAARLLEALQPRNAAEVLDDLQIRVINQVFDQAKLKRTMGKTTDLMLHIPNFEVSLLSSPVSTTAGPATVGSELKLTLSALSLASRNRLGTLGEQSGAVGDKFSAFHVSLRSALFTVRETGDDLSSQISAVRGSLEDVAFWAVTNHAASSNARIRNLEIATDSGKVQYLGMLALDLVAQATDISEAFSNLESTATNRLQDLATFIVAEGGRIADPTFMTRPSYALRSAIEHLRIHDSWKIVSRFRHIYESLSAGHKDAWSSRSFDKTSVVTRDALHNVIASFNDWRNWELAKVDRSFAMQQITGDVPTTQDDGKAHNMPVTASLITGTMQLLIDPGPKQSELASDGLTIAVTIGTGSFPLKTEHAEQDSFRAVAVSFSSRSLVLRFDWELCEMVERLGEVEIRPKTSEKSSSSRKDQSTNVTFHPARRSQYHLVANLDIFSIILDGINLKSISVSQGLKFSVLFSEQAKANPRTQLNVMLHTDAASSELASHSRVLTMSKVRSPSIYFLLETHRREEQDVNVWRVAAKCQEICYEVKEDILGLMEVISLVIVDEVTHMQRILRSISGRAPITVRSMNPQRPRNAVNEIRISLLLEEYHVTVALLHSLQYVVAGKVARISVWPSRQGASVIDFDLKEQSHKVQTQTETEIEAHSISVLNMPPINGRVVTRISDDEMVIEIITAIERIVIEAAAVHDLFDIMKRPEIINVLREIRDEAQSIKHHVSDIIGESKRQKSPAGSDDRLEDKKESGSRALVYLAHFTIAGLGVHASAPGEGVDAHSAHLDFVLGCVQLKAVNRLESSGSILKYPEIHLGLHHLGFELARTREEVAQPCGNLNFGVYLTCSSRQNAVQEIVRAYHIQSDAVEINLFAETASTVVGVISHLQDRIKDLDISREVKYLKRLRKPRASAKIDSSIQAEPSSEEGPTRLFGAIYSLEVQNIQVSWIVGGIQQLRSGRESEDLVLSFKRIDLATSRENAARLVIEDFQLQMVPRSRRKSERSLNSALLPEVIFNVAYLSSKQDRRFAFQAAGKALDLRMTSRSMIAANVVKRSIAQASEQFRAASASWHAIPTQSGESRRNLLGTKRLGSLLVDADFAGAVVYMQGSKLAGSKNSAMSVFRGGRLPQHGRYGQFTDENSANSTTLRAPGVALKVEYQDNGMDDPSLKAELKVDASSNILYPTVVPLVMEMTSSIKEIVGSSEVPDHPSRPKPARQAKASSQTLLDQESLLKGDPSTILGRCRLNVGLRIRQQEFSLSCQPIARVAATAKFEDIYITANTVRTTDTEHFLAISGALNRLQASVQHVYSRESTGHFDIESITVSLMNSRHVSGVSGISTILQVGPMKAQINARQLQDILIFREIWAPPEVRARSRPPPAPAPAPASPATGHSGESEPHPYLVQRYQQVAAATAFPWDVAIAISELDLQLDLGQALGKSAFMIANLWMSIKKSSDWEQNLCMGFERVGIDSVGRMSGFVELQKFGLRTSIQWPSRQQALNETPLIQASIGFGHLRIKAAFDYQAFLVADITSFNFLMYNVRESEAARGDRLVGILDGDEVQVFCTTTSAAQAIALYQAFIRLGQEKRTAYEASLQDIEKFLHRRSTAGESPAPADGFATRERRLSALGESRPTTGPSFLHTDVVVTLRAINVGAFPSTFHDNQIFKLEASDAQARFAVSMTDTGKIQSHLGLTLGQLRIALSAVRQRKTPTTSGDVQVEEVVLSATSSRGGTILKVPRVVATMETWQVPGSSHIDYIFTSSFEGKVDVGWNYSRISFIRAMWAGHSRALAQRLGRPLPPSAVRITGAGLSAEHRDSDDPEVDAVITTIAPENDSIAEGDDEQSATEEKEKDKITAVVEVPQSKYDYTALVPPLIETPQLRDMGEATPPLEWIGLNRERLPNLTHQIVIVSLLEIAREVEDAYGKILGSNLGG